MAFNLTVTYASEPDNPTFLTDEVGRFDIEITDMPKQTTHWDYKFTFGNHTETFEYNMPEAKTKYQKIWSTWLTNATSGKLTVTVSYFNISELIKSETKSITVTLPSWFKPSIPYVGASPHAYIVGAEYGFLQGKTKAELDVGACGTGGAKIVSVSIKNMSIGWNQIYKLDASEQDTTFISPPLSMAGTNRFEIKVTDTRGRSASYTKEIKVNSYAPPTISVFTADRYNASGQKDGTGTYAKAYAEIWYTNIYNGTDDMNSVTAKVYYTDRNGQRDFIILDSHEWSTIFGGGFTTDKSHTITLVVTDAVGGETRKDFEIMGTTYLLDFLPGGNGVGIGCEATTSGQLDVGFNTLFKGSTNTFEKETAFNNKAIAKNAFLTGNKTDWNDGVAGAWIGNNGTMHLSGTNPNITFHYNNATSGYDGIAINSSGSANVFSNYTAGKLYVGNNSTPQTVIRGKFVQLISGNSGYDVKFDNTAFRPSQTGKVHCGYSSMRWLNGYFSGTLYAGNGTINTSDRKAKKDISDIDIQFAKDFVMDLKPKTYKLKKDGESHEGKRTKMGFIAQDAHETGLKVKKDLALYQAHVRQKDGSLTDYDDSMTDVSDENLEWGMDYSQFHAPHIRLTQDHEERISKLEETVAKQEDIINKQEETIKQQAEIIKLLQMQLGMTYSEGE